MASLHPPLAIAAAAHRDIETAHYGAPDNLFLILGFAAFRFHAAAAMRAALRQRNRDRSSTRAGMGGKPAGHSGGLDCGLGAAGWFWCAARMRCGLALAGAQRGFQFPPQPFGFLFQPMDLFAQPLVFLLALDPNLVLEQTRCSQVAYLRRACRLVSSNPTVAEAAAFVQRNRQAANFRGLSGW